MLNKEHTELLKTLQMSAGKTIQDWLYFFEDLQMGYSKREKKLTFFKRIHVVLVLLFVVLLLGDTNLISNGNHLKIALTGTFAIWIWTRVEMARNKLVSTKSPYFFIQINDFVVPLLNVLAKDVKQNTIINLQLDLRDPLWTSEFKKSTYKHNGWDVSFHSLIALKLRAMFEGKIVLDFIVSDKFKKLEKTKQSASGRTKRKNKFKGKVSYIAKVAFPKEKFSSTEQLAEKKDRVVKVSKSLQINSQDKYYYQTKKACEAIADAFAGMTKVA